MGINYSNGLPGLPPPNYQYITRTEDALNVLPEIEKHELIEVDTETTALDPFIARVTLIQLGLLGKSYVFDVREGNVNAEVFKPLLEGDGSLKLLQNAVYDFEVLKTNFNIELNRIYDTMLVEQLLYLGLHPKASLDHLVGKYLHMRMPKDIATSFVDYHQEYQEYQLRYAANDVSVLRDIYNMQMPKLRQDGLMRVAKLEFDFIKPLAEMELNGMLLDVPQWRCILEEMIVERDKLRIQLGNIFEDTVDQTTMFGVSLMNLDSPAQVIKGLQKVGVHVDSTDVKELNKHKKNPIVQLLLDYRKYEKFITTYGEPMIDRIHSKTGRLHTKFKQMVDTGRMSSSNPNLQNIPKEQKYRSCFIARPGYKIITCDMSAAELRIIANLSRDPLWIKIFNEGGDLHTVSAAGIYGISEEEVMADKKLNDEDSNKKNYRSNSKPISFGLAYGLSEHGLSLRLGISKDEAKKMIDNYFKKYPLVHKFLEESGRNAVLNRFSISISGRRRYYTLPDPTDPEFKKMRGAIERQGKNMGIQGSNADTIKQAMVHVVKRILPYDARLLLTVHDEIIVEAREDQVDEVKLIVEQSVRDGFDDFFELVKMKAEADVADYWVKG
jgi:DNA polymerase I-like protein with 3'-5' exonuclease and polymerase domains